MTISPAWTRTSGDMIADRRYAYARDALADGDPVAARDLFEQALEIAPHWPPAAFGRAEAALALGEAEAARQALQQCLALDPADRLGAHALLARLEGRADRTAMPDAYVAALFDDYAPRFDDHLVEALDYRAPALLRDLLRRAREPLFFREACDLGCGTGLMGEALRGAVERLEGVDLSAGMLARAEATGLYARLEQAGINAYLARVPASSKDLVIAADVFCYVPDLGGLFPEVRRVLVPGGLFAFTVQIHPGEGVIIGEDRRVQHAMAHIRDLLARSGFLVLEETEASSRRDRGIEVAGAIYLATPAEPGPCPLPGAPSSLT